MLSESQAFHSTDKSCPYSNLRFKGAHIEKISISEARKCTHNSDQTYLKEAFEQRKHGYFMSVSEGGSWPAWMLKKEKESRDSFGWSWILTGKSLPITSQEHSSIPGTDVCSGMRGDCTTLSKTKFCCRFDHIVDNLYNSEGTLCRSCS